MKVLLTEEQMKELSAKVATAYPWTQVKNTIYNASLIGLWKVEINDSYAEILKGI